MSEVREVHDALLDRTVAVKRLKSSDEDSSVARTRFLREARITAALQHPGVVPVLDLGWNDQGAVWFSMPVVEGLTLDAIVAALHAGDPSWPLRRVVDVLYRVTQTLAYAHHEGVVHRDVKPANIMVGRFGEVRLLDWGIAVRVTPGRASLARRNQATGTPSYMAPEQALGAAPAPSSDVYAVGAVLYELLTGAPPFDGDRTTVLTRLRTEAPPAPETTLPGADERLVRICTHAMTREPEGRPTASALAGRLRDWLDGADARDNALQCVQRYQGARRRVAHGRGRALWEREQARALLAELPAWASEESKAKAWAHEDAAEAHETAVSEALVEAEGHLAAAFSLVPNLPEAREALAAQHLEEHAAAEARGDVRGAREAEQRLRSQLAHLPRSHPRRVELAHYLKGDGALSLRVDSEGASAVLRPFVEHHRRLVPGEPLITGPLPWSRAPVPMGSYVVVITARDGVEVRYPVRIERQAHWQAGTVHLPAPGEIDERACYVPAGPFQCGGAPEIDNSLPAEQVLVDGFAMARFPVTNAQFISFLEDLVAQGREDEALALAPRERAGTAAKVGPLIYRYDGRQFHLQPDVDGDLWEPDWPVVNVATPSCVAYAEWLSARTGRRWRLPTEYEWEKAGRGVDGRALPWGDHADASWFACRESHRRTPLAQPVDSFPVDESVYGVRGLAGNIRDRTSTRFVAFGVEQDRELLVERGCTWLTPVDKAHLCTRSWAPPTHRFTLLGFRLVHDLG